MYPVDLLAPRLIEISVQPENLGKIFHFTNSQSPSISTVGKLMQKFFTGVLDLKSCSYPIWRQKLIEEMKLQQEVRICSATQYFI
jgi:hypothetical protein